MTLLLHYVEIKKVDSSKTIRVSKDVYDKIFDMGVGWKTSFNDVLTDLVNNADKSKSSAAAAKED